MDNGISDKIQIPEHLQYKGDWPWVKFHKGSKLGYLDGIVLTRDFGGLTLVAKWVRTDSFVEDRDVK